MKWEPPAAPSVRKEVRSLTTEEFEAYAKAMLRFHNETIEDYVIPNWATLTAFHAEATLNETYDALHYGPHFLLGHALLMKAFELGIQYYDSTTAAHYWDWTTNATDIFTEDMYGNFDPRTGDVLDGYFFDLEVNRAEEATKYTSWLSDDATLLRGVDSALLPTPKISRSVGMFPSVEPATAEEVENCVYNTTTYKELWCCVFYTEEARDECSSLSTADEGGLHGKVHSYSSGSLAILNPPLPPTFVPFDGSDLATSTNDPVFFAHHAQVDRIYQAWITTTTETNVATILDPCGGYDEDPPPGHGLHDPLYPLIDLVDEHYKINPKGGDGKPDTAFDVCRAFYFSKSAGYVYDTLNF
ncbi:hypothetical protein CTAYLR_002131 [Chrysophaeum taylorii]|uniref:Tyrosinase copper-binding domain-containing protein n=1 Tax=Chrysophaeum taylorii TaxID=2483200 RepID=A0AAD7UN59_9STRA|nr:hypothetical protein CTAYLR_002131 [Chrysophaeum taylorii]